ncbi:MAG: lysylphosphatidylglycerol synthase domain-containing protein [Gaiellaceae bacterium]
MAAGPAALLALLKRHPRAVAAAQALAFVIFIGFAVWAVQGDFHDAAQRLRDASLFDFLLGCAAVAAYYLLFVVGWMRILGAWGIEIPYGVALRAEMVSMLAKYVPGGVWTPAARVVAARRAGITDAGLVTASMFLEAGISAVAGIIVFVVSLSWEKGVDAPLVPLLVFGVVVAVLVHPRIFQPLASRIVRRFGGQELPPLPEGTLLGLLAYYSFTWLVGGIGLFFMVRAVGGSPDLATVAFMGGVGAVGAIVAVLAIFAPSGLGPREATMYGLLLAVTSQGAALGATVLNRVAITVVELLLFVVGGLVFRARDEASGRELAESQT